MSYTFSPFFREGEKPSAVVCIDPSDPDNLRLLVGTIRWFGPDNVFLLLTGRAAMDPTVVTQRVAAINAQEGDNPNPIKDIPLTDWDPIFSEVLLQASALRIEKLLTLFDCADFGVYHGGVAPKAGVPHALHIDDFTGFGDITPDEERALRAGATLTKSQDELVQKLAGKPFVIFLGGPATGAHALVESHPEFVEQLRGMFAQYAMLDGTTGMQWEGRTAGAQFNVMLDPVAGKELCETLLGNGVPIYFLPTNVTRNNKIGFGVPTVHADAFYSTPGLQELARIHQIWYEAAIRNRPDEVILEHDFATLLLFLQLTGNAPCVYEHTPMRIIDFVTKEKEAGIIRFAEDADSHLYVATRLLDPDAYVAMLQMSVVAHTYHYKHMVICGSLEENALPADRAAFEQCVLDVAGGYLRQGHIVHWGSHPRMQDIMRNLARRHAPQMHQYLIREHAGSRITEIPDAHVHMFDTLTDMRIAMLRDKEVGIFLSGRTDFATTESKMPGVLAECFGFRVLNPKGMVVPLTPAQGTVPLLNGAMESLGLFTALAAQHSAFARECATFLLAAHRTST